MVKGAFDHLHTGHKALMPGVRNSSYRDRGHNDDPIILVDNPMKAKHAKPPVEEHGLCLANPARVLVVGGCGASKTTTILNCIARG